MTKAILDKQLLITVDNKVGTLAEVSGVVSSSGINLIAVCAYAVDNKGVIMFVSENNNRVKQLLTSQGYDVREEDIILLTVDNKPGALQALTQKIADAGIDLTLIYGSVEQKGKTSRIVLISEDNEGVISVLKAS